MRRAWNTYCDDVMEKEIVDAYLAGESTKDLCKKYGFKTKKSITDKVKKHGYNPMEIRKEIEIQNKEYYQFSLDKIDSVVKAYILGIIITDGNVNEADGHFEINLTDEDAMTYLSSQIGKDYKTYPSYNDSIRNKNIHRITFKNKRLVEELKRFGVINNKSKILQPPNLMEDELKYLPYLFRGIIDGNGWIRKDGKEFYICTASKVFADWLIKTLEEKLFMKNVHLIDSTREWNGRPSPLWYVRTALDRNISILKTIVYDNKLGMNRKFDRLHNEPSENIMEDTL